MSSSYDIVICGAGITGASTAFHLKQMGYQPLVVHNSPRVTDSTMGVAHVDGGDQITRVADSYGDQAAIDLWSFFNESCQNLRKTLETMGLPFQVLDHVRLAHEGFEQQELRMGSKLLKRIHKSLSLVGDGEELVQTIKSSVLKFDVQQLLKALLSGIEVKKLELISAIEDVDGVNLQTSEGGFCSEIFVGAAHLGNQTLLDLPEGALVPFVDQWSEGHVNSMSDVRFKDSYVSWRYNLCSAVFDQTGTVTVAGGRYVRKNAGIGVRSAEFSDVVKKICVSEFKKTISETELIFTNNGVGLSCRVCDELPIIGPMFGKSRSLLATGFGGQGLSLGFKAGKCLAELIHLGKCSSLPRVLWPERLRALDER